MERRRKRGMRLVDNDCEVVTDERCNDGPAQASLRLLAVDLASAPRSATSATTTAMADNLPEVVEMPGGCLLAERPLTEAERRAALARHLRARGRPRHESTCETAEQRQAALRSLVLYHADRQGPPRLVRAGQLLRDHGDNARGALHRAWRPDWGVTLLAVDELLEQAGLPAKGPLL